MGQNQRAFKASKIKIFDPADAILPFDHSVELTDATLAKRGDRWWMYLAGEAHGYEGIELFSASLPPGVALAASGWTVTASKDNPRQVAAVAAHPFSKSWDLKGGRHCPSYVKGYDPHAGKWVERIYYAGAPENPWGPYSIGYLEWNGDIWMDRSEPVFLATEAWEHGSVYEPNLIYADGKWKMWYVAGSNFEDYLVQGLSESEDGREWSPHKIFAPAEQKMFDFRVIERNGEYEAVFSRVWLGKTSPPESTGLWWCRSKSLSSDLKDWGAPLQLMNAADGGWHAGPWRPSVQYSETDMNRMFVFFDGGYTKKNDSSGFPYAFTLGCLEVDWLE